MKKFYGIRFLGGNKTCTTGQPNEKTGRYNVAVDVMSFNSRSNRDEWVNNERRSAPTGSGGGERLAVKKSDLKKYRRGMSGVEFDQHINDINRASDPE